MTRPASIVWFERLYLGSLVMGLVDDFVYWDGSFAIVYARRFLPLQCFKFGLLVLLCLLVSRRRSNAAKWAIVIVFAASLSFFILDLISGVLSGSSVAAIGETLLESIALGLLLTESAKDWLARRPVRLSTEASLKHTFE